MGASQGLQTAAHSGGGELLEATLESRLPEQLAIGRGTALFVYGSCFNRRQGLNELRILLGSSSTSAMAHSMPRLDGVENGMPYRRAFWGIVPIAPIAAPTRVTLGLSARLDDGREAAAELAEIDLLPGPTEPAAAGANSGGRPTVGICMATFEPPLDLFERQVESMRRQTLADWTCFVSDDHSAPDLFDAIRAIIVDDPRFVISRSPRRLGFYHNFERALAMVPEGVPYVALADQDDRWYPEKLEALLEGLGSANLVYSDARIIGPTGDQVSPTYWSGRRNNHTSFASLLVSNTVTGAASLFRRELLDLALPFPPRHGNPFHDHWLALVALATGEIAYVDRPLYDYVQHEAAALGHSAANLGAGRASDEPPRGTRWTWRAYLVGWRRYYFFQYCHLRAIAMVLRERCGDQLGRGARRTLRRLLGRDASLVTAAWLLLRRVRALAGRNETLSAERTIARGIAWRRVLALAGRRKAPGRFRNDSQLPPWSSPIDEPVRFPLLERMRERFAPLELAIEPTAPERINLLIPRIDLKHLFGGYIAKFNLARRLAEHGRRVRIVTVEPIPELPASWRKEVEAYSGLRGLFEAVEIAFARDEDRPLAVSPSDRFIATTWWTAHIATDAISKAGRPRFLWLIQEYEPLTYPMGSHAALAAEPFSAPHAALFSTELLRDYFRSKRIGVFANGTEAGERASASFQNAITPVEPPPDDAVRERHKRRLLFYGRPEEHAQRNMFELGVIALAELAAEGAFDDGWELYGIGTVAGGGWIDLGRGVSLELLPRQSQSRYAELLRSSDVGLALMHTPHPSLVPIEMASAGMLVVTNSFENKTAEALAAISPNLIAVEPRRETLKRGLRETIASAGDFERRRRGAAVRWSRDWDSALDDDLIGRVVELLRAC